MAYSPYYANGWQDGSTGGTPITAAALNNIEDGIVEASNKTYLTTSNMEVANTVITLESSQSYVENNILHVAFTILLTGNRTGAIVRFKVPGTSTTYYIPSARTSYCFLVNASTGAVVVASMAAGGNGYVTCSATLPSGTRYYCFGTVPLD